jgi:short-subunit dehydrogenase
MVCAYAASKWALEALVHAARRETRGMGFRITTANIGAVKSRMLNAHIDQLYQLLENAGAEERRFYGNAYKAHAESTKQFNKIAITAEKVALKLLQIADSKKPASSYAIGVDAKLFRVLNWVLPTAVVDKIMEV